jgi:hypothetical protein
MRLRKRTGIALPLSWRGSTGCTAVGGRCLFPSVAASAVLCVCVRWNTIVLDTIRCDAIR